MYDNLFSGVDVLPTLLDLLGVPIPDRVQGVSHAAQLVGPSGGDARAEVFTEKTFHDSFDPIRAIRTKDFSYIENYAHRPALDLPLDILDSPSGAAVVHDVQAQRPRRELYDLRTDPDERDNLAERAEYAEIRDRLAAQLREWRTQTGDRVPSEAEGTALAQQATARYLARLDRRPNVRSAFSEDRGYLEKPSAGSD